MSSPFVAGYRDIARRFRSGSPVVLWIGDSISVAMVGLFQKAMPFAFGGYGAVFFGFDNLASSKVTFGQAAMGSGSALGGDSNYSPFQTNEYIFNGTAFTAIGDGAADALANRLCSSGGETPLSSTRGADTFDGTDWLSGVANPVCHAIFYCDSNSIDNFVRVTVHDGSNTVLGSSPYLSLHSAQPSYQRFSVPFTAPGGATQVQVNLQTADGTPTSGKNAVLVMAWIDTGSGVRLIDASVGGTAAYDFANLSKISQAAWSGVLPLIDGLTDVVICHTQNGTPVKQDWLDLVTRIRTAVPGIPITFVSTYDTSSDRSAYVDACYTAFQETSTSAWLNLFAAGGIYAQTNALGFIADGTHPSDAGIRYYPSVLWGLIEQLAGSGGGRRFRGHLSHVFG